MCALYESDLGSLFASLSLHKIPQWTPCTVGTSNACMYSVDGGPAFRVSVCPAALALSQYRCFSCRIPEAKIRHRGHPSRLPGFQAARGLCAVVLCEGGLVLRGGGSCCSRRCLEGTVHPSGSRVNRWQLLKDPRPVTTRIRKLAGEGGARDPIEHSAGVTQSAWLSYDHEYSA